MRAVFRGGGRHFVRGFRPISLKFSSLVSDSSAHMQSYQWKSAGIEDQRTVQNNRGIGCQ